VLAVSHGRDDEGAFARRLLAGSARERLAADLRRRRLGEDPLELRLAPAAVGLALVGEALDERPVARRAELGDRRLLAARRGGGLLLLGVAGLADPLPLALDSEALRDVVGGDRALALVAARGEVEVAEVARRGGDADDGGLAGLGAGAARNLAR